MKHLSIFLLGFVILTAFSTKNNTTPIVQFYLTNRVYAGVDNPILIKVNNVPNDEVTFTVSDNATLTYVDNYQYNLKVEKPRSRVVIDVKHKDQIIRTIELISKQVPLPEPWLGGGNFDGKFNRIVFKGQLGISAVLQNFEHQVRCVVTEYELTRITKDGQRNSLKSKNKFFDGAVRKLIDDAKVDDIYIFSNIKSKCSSDSEERTHKNSVVAFITE